LLTQLCSCWSNFIAQESCAISCRNLLLCVSWTLHPTTRKHSESANLRQRWENSVMLINLISLDKILCILMFFDFWRHKTHLSQFCSACCWQYFLAEVRKTCSTFGARHLYCCARWGSSGIVLDEHFFELFFYFGWLFVNKFVFGWYAVSFWFFWILFYDCWIITYSSVHQRRTSKFQINEQANAMFCLWAWLAVFVCLD